MKFYFEVINKDIVNIDIEKFKDDNIVITVKNIDEFYEKTEKYNVSEKIEMSVREFIDTTENESIKRYEIKHWVSNRSFGELIDMYENNEIHKPEMQREFVWDSLKCSRFIESIVLGLPIPPLFLLETGKNKYELIDGLQRLTTLVKYVTGESWHSSRGNKRSASKLSSKVLDEIKGKTFVQLDSEYQKIIKRSTVPLIEFKQFEPDDFESKYLIYERINTGSDKLNAMQIRKSLAYGRFMEQLYEFGEEFSELREFFSTGALKKDFHIEALLRIIIVVDFLAEKYDFKISGIKNILNDYCEKNRQRELDDNLKKGLIKAFKDVINIFDDKVNCFKKIDKNTNEYIGKINIGIMEALIGSMVFESFDISCKESTQILDNYISEIKKAYDDIENPFSISTGTKIAFENRIKICYDIIGATYDR